MARTTYKNKSIAVDTELTYLDVQNLGRFAVITSGIRVTLPDAINTLCRDNWDWIVDNEADGPILVKGNFANGRTGILLAPGARLWGMYVAKMGENANEIRYLVMGDTIGEAGSYEPTLAWTTADPNDITKTSYWWIENGMLCLGGEITVEDGNAASNLTIAPPDGIIPPINGVEVPFNCTITVDGVLTANPLAYFDQGTSVAAAARLIKFRAFPTLTADKVAVITWFGCVEMSGFLAYTVTPTWATATPTPITATARVKEFGNFGVMLAQWASADSKGATGVSIPIPLPTPDLDAYVPFAMIQKQVAANDAVAWSNPLGLLDLADATEANHLGVAQNFTTCIDTKAVQVSVCIVFPILRTTNALDFDPAPVYTQDGTVLADPVGTVVEKGYWAASHGMAAFLTYLSATDGNDCTDVATALPIKPAGLLFDLPLMSYQYQHTDTKRNPCAFIDVSAENIGVSNLHKLDDTEATKLYIGGLYPLV